MTQEELRELVESLSLRGLKTGAPCRCGDKLVPQRWDADLKMTVCPACAATAKQMGADERTADRRLADLAAEFARVRRISYPQALLEVTRELPDTTSAYLDEVARRVQRSGLPD
jgi:hypothetical protein